MSNCVISSHHTAWTQIYSRRLAAEAAMWHRRSGLRVQLRRKFCERALCFTTARPRSWSLSDSLPLVQYSIYNGWGLVHYSYTLCPIDTYIGNWPLENTVSWETQVSGNWIQKSVWGLKGELFWGRLLKRFSTIKWLTTTLGVQGNVSFKVLKHKSLLWTIENLQVLMRMVAEAVDCRLATVHLW